MVIDEQPMPDLKCKCEHEPDTSSLSTRRFTDPGPGSCLVKVDDLDSHQELYKRHSRTKKTHEGMVANIE